MPYVMDFNRAARVDEFAQIAIAMGVSRKETDEALSFAAIAAVKALFKDIKIPATLAELGLPEDKLEWTAEQSFTAQRLVNNNPMPLDVKKLHHIITAAYYGSSVKAAA